ncbi:hypothetical protein MMC15_003783 [Xylographa vitiligo]|nr:hypothetical protein [Xylographa vitiligo]
MDELDDVEVEIEGEEIDIEDEEEDIEGYMRDLADGIAAGGDAIELLEDLLDIVSNTWTLYDSNDVDYDELEESILNLIRSDDNSIFNLVAATYMNKYMDWLWHPSNQILANEDALRVYESHLTTLHQLGYQYTEACAHMANVNNVPLTPEQEPYRDHFVWWMEKWMRVTQYPGSPPQPYIARILVMLVMGNNWHPFGWGLSNEFTFRTHQPA